MLEAFGLDGQHPCDGRGVLGMAARREREQRVDGGKPVVPGGHAIVPVGFEVVQEVADQPGVEIAQVEVAGLGPGPLGAEGEQQPERVPVGGDGVGAGSELRREPLGEERLEGGGERRHRSAPG